MIFMQSLTSFWVTIKSKFYIGKNIKNYADVVQLIAYIQLEFLKLATALKEGTYNCI